MTSADFCPTLVGQISSGTLNRPLMHPAELYPTELRLTVGFVVTRRLACPSGLTARLCSCGRINAIGPFASTPRGADLAYGFSLRQLIWWAPFIPLVCSCAERTGGDVHVALSMPPALPR